MNIAKSLKGTLQGIFRGLGLEVQLLRNADVERQVVRKVLALTGASVVLDVGANVGQFGDLLLQGGFAGVIVSFEAVPAVHKQLSVHAKNKSSRWVVAPCVALGSSSGEVTINVSENTVSSSVLPMHDRHLDAAPHSKYVRRQTVTVARLDELAPELIPWGGDLLVKIDTQGYEMEVLKGAVGVMDRIVALQLELSLVPLYEGASTFSEMVAYVQSLGFEMFNFVPAFKDKRTGRLLQVDGFFVRANKGLR